MELLIAVTAFCSGIVVFMVVHYFYGLAFSKFLVQFTITTVGLFASLMVDICLWRLRKPDAGSNLEDRDVTFLCCRWDSWEFESLVDDPFASCIPACQPVPLRLRAAYPFHPLVSTANPHGVSTVPSRNIVRYFNMADKMAGKGEMFYEDQLKIYHKARLEASQILGGHKKFYK